VCPARKKSRIEPVLALLQKGLQKQSLRVRGRWDADREGSQLGPGFTAVIHFGTNGSMTETCHGYTAAAEKGPLLSSD
jgi:hypothetical protein